MRKTSTLKEIIVVEGRDDEAAINRAIEADTIATHGFGIRKETWDLIDKAYKERGIIIFTDPDFSGEEIRKKLNARFPNSKNAYLGVEEATKKGNIGIENASPENIISALDLARCTIIEKRQEFTLEDLRNYGLSGEQGSAEKRTKLGKLLGIGYGNSNAFLKKLNQFGISRQEFIEKIDGE
jgi:ribonuclease M5